MAEGSEATSNVFGITASRVRGALALLVMGLALYLILFKSDPPPMFDEIEIEIPLEPKTNFDERSIVLPEFSASPTLPEEAAGEGVEINPTTEQETLEPEPVAPDELAFATPEPEGDKEQNDPEPPDEGAPADDGVTELSAPEPIEAPADTSLANRDTYFVQVLATGSKDKGDKLAKELGVKLDVPALVSPVERDGGILFRVRLGPFGTDKARALNTLARLREIDPETEARVVTE